MGETPEEKKRQSREFWDRMAPQWERRRRWNARATSRLNDWLVDAIDPAPGQTVLDLAAGTGEAGFAAAGRIGSEGRLISSDFSSEMVRAAQRNGAELGVENVDFRTLDAENLELGDDSVDGAVCRFGLMLFPEPVRAAAEIRRVLKPGGHFACTTWGPPERNQWITVSTGLMIERGHMEPPAPDGGPGMFSLSDAASVGAVLKQGGFASVRSEPMEIEWSFESGDNYWMFVSEMQGPVSVALAELDEAQRSEVREELERRARPFAVGDGYALPGLALNTIAS